jgi:DNA-directed RNA polymerase specialized sigma24 family protein
VGKRQQGFRKLKEIETIDRFSGERSPYQDWLKSNHKSTEYGVDSEPVLANPDSLPEIEIVAPSTPQQLMGEAINHLQGRQRECYLLTMREGKSFFEAAKILNIGKGRVQQYRERAIKFIKQYCRAAIQKGRV